MATFQDLNISHMWPVASILESKDRKHFHPRRELLGCAGQGITSILEEKRGCRPAKSDGFVGSAYTDYLPYNFLRTLFEAARILFYKFLEKGSCGHQHHPWKRSQFRETRSNGSGWHAHIPDLIVPAQLQRGDLLLATASHRVGG